MLAQERQNRILETVTQNGQATVTELCRMLSVSDETVRRDLNTLAGSGKLRKVHGGAVRVSVPVRDASYEERKQQRLKEKRAIAKRAAALLSDGERIAIDSGSTTEEFAKAIFGVRGLTVLTDALPVAWILREKLCRGDFDGRLILIGGEVEPSGGSVTDAMAVEMLSRFSVDRAILGATAVSGRGVMFGNPEDAVIGRAMADCAAKVTVLAESEKLEKESFSLCLPLGRLDTLITDTAKPVSGLLLQELTAAGVTLFREDC